MMVLNRPAMTYLRHIVAEVDPRATMIVGKVHEASYNELSDIGGLPQMPPKGNEGPAPTGPS
jgi:hypothetical protein